MLITELEYKLVELPAEPGTTNTDRNCKTCLKSLIYMILHLGVKADRFIFEQVMLCLG